METTSCLIITFLVFQLFQFGYALRCQTTERESLVKFKHSLYDPSNRLSSWKGDDCCDWAGVRCHNITSHVSHLNLQNPQYCEFDDVYYSDCYNASTELRGHNLDPSLVNLTNLRYLNLVGNNFQESSIPEFIGSMKHLRYLGLSFASFGGVLPPQLGNLTSLRYLDLSHNSFNSSLPLWLRNMKHLKYLDLSYASFGGVLSHQLGNLTSLRYLDLSYNSLSGSVPLWLTNMRALEVIDLNSNSFSHIEGGSLTGIVGNLCNLKKLDLSNNYIQGEIGENSYPICIANSLEVLSLGSNRMTGTLPSWLGDLTNITDLYLNDNRFHGLIPQSIGRLSSLDYLELSSNLLEGTLSESHFANLSNLLELDLGSNSLNLNFTSTWIPPFQLFSFDMSYNKLQGPFPQWIQTQYNLFVLDLSHNRIVGPLTLLPSGLWFIRLSHNLLSGPLSQYQLFTNDYNPTLPTSLCQLKGLGFIFLENNSLNGTIPNDCWYNSTYLSIINLSNNALEGQIPTTLFGTLFPRLQILDLGGNKLTGQVPNITGTQLSILRLRDNQLGGVIPLQLCSLPRLQILDLANTNLAGSIPNCLGHLNGMTSKQEVIYLNEYALGENIIEVLKGELMSYTNKMYLVNMDLSCNGLVGSIPEELSNLSTLVGLNLSYNHLSGGIPENIGQMTSLESLDLSNNNISGIIPASISALGFLSRLNLSHNKLRGEIPTGQQLQTLNYPSIYAGNSALCGDPLPDKCKNGDKQEQGKQVEPEQEDDNEDHFEKTVLCCVIILGFVTGFWGVIGTLLLKTQWTHALFQRVEDFMDYLYVQVVVKINRRFKG